MRRSVASSTRPTVAKTAARATAAMPRARGIQAGNGERATTATSRVNGSRKYWRRFCAGASADDHRTERAANEASAPSGSEISRGSGASSSSRTRTRRHASATAEAAISPYSSSRRPLSPPCGRPT